MVLLKASSSMDTLKGAQGAICMEIKTGSLRHRRNIALPLWLKKARKTWENTDFSTQDSRMRFVLELSRQNIEQSSGGPFSAAIFTRDTHQLISVGVNRVVPEHCSLAHGEVMALLMAQELLGSHDLAAEGLPSMEMVINAQPCIQCYGAIIWSGLHHVVFAASSADVERLTGFDEGPTPSDWVEQWERRGITVEQGVLRDEACAIIAGYRSSGAPVYNSKHNKLSTEKSRQS